MKDTGIVRRLDHLGRIVTPMELRKAFDIKAEDAVEIFTEGDTIILRKYQPGCIFCGEIGKLTSYMGKFVCEHCRQKIG